MSLTKREIDQLKCADRGGKRFRVADGHGLYIEVMPSGSKFWRHRSCLYCRLQFGFAVLLADLNIRRAELSIATLADDAKDVPD